MVDYVTVDELPKVVDTIVARVDDLVVKHLAAGFEIQRQKLEGLGKDMDSRFDGIDERLDSMETRLTAIEGFLQMDKARH